MHGITRSAITKAQGGRWSSGFWSGFASSSFAAPKNLGMAKGTAMMAVVGGTVSVISGGKFANGAVSGAFVHMFNNYSGYDNSVEGQNQRIKDYSAEYPEFVKFIDEGINILDIAISAVSGAATSVVKAIIFDKVINPYTLTAIGVAGAGRNVKMSFVANAAGVRAPAQKAWHDLTNVQISNPYTNPAANPAYF